MKHNNNEHTHLLMYVDDVILAGNSDSEIKRVKEYLHKQFSIKDLGAAKYFLGVEMSRTENGTFP